MPEPFSIAAVGLAHAAGVAAYLRIGSAVSFEARSAEANARCVVARFETSQALFGETEAAIVALRAMAEECAVEDWDGCGALAVCPPVVARAERFIRALPVGLPLPVFAAEPDGSISLDWIASRHRLLSVSVGTNDRLAYAWLDGTDKGHAVARFDGAEVPVRLLSAIRDIVDHGTAALRAA